MTHDIVPVQVTKDGFGDESMEELEEEKGFIEYGQRETFGTEDQQIKANATLFLKRGSQFDATLKDGENQLEWKFKDVKNDRTLQMMDWQVIDDPRTGKTHHYEILLR